MKIEVLGNSCLHCYIFLKTGIQMEHDVWDKIFATEGIEVVIDKTSKRDVILSEGIKWEELALKVRDYE